MGMKYMIAAFNYPYRGEEACKQTGWLIVALFWLIVFSRKYDGVNLEKRD